MLESEAAAIRMDLKRALIRIGEMESAMGKLQDDIANLKNENARLKKDNARLEARLAFYGSANMSSSTTSLYNAARKKFRKGRGEKISGNPGEKIKGDSKADEDEGDGNGGQGRDGSSGDGDGGQEKAARIGPPAGHAGISHDNKPEFTVRHALKAGACPGCHVGLSHVRPTCKLIRDLDERYATRTFTAVIEAAACPECGKKFKAPNPYLKGTSYGPVMLAVINALFARAVTDEDIAHLVRELFGVRTCTNAVTNARTAVSEYMVLIGMIARIKAAILRQIWVQMDETVFKRGDGHRGYVWLACTPVAVFVWFAYNRSSTVLTEHFDWLRGKPTVCDGMPGYPSALTDIIQRCFVHLLRKAEELAVKSGDPADEARYDMMLETVLGCQGDQGPGAVDAHGPESTRPRNSHVVRGCQGAHPSAKRPARHVHVPVVSWHATPQQRHGARHTGRHHTAAQLKTQDHERKGQEDALHAAYLRPYLRQTRRLAWQGAVGMPAGFRLGFVRQGRRDTLLAHRS